MAKAGRAEARASAEDWCASGGGGHDGWQRAVNLHVQEEEFRPIELHCCPTNFRRIEWYRLDSSRTARVLLPSLANSTFEVLEEGRVLRTDEAQARDAGFYECVVHRAPIATPAVAVAVAHSASASENELRFTVDIIVAEKTNENKLLQPKFEIFTQRIGDKLEIRCSVIGETPVRWVQFDKEKQFLPHLKSDNERRRKNVIVQATNSLESKSGHANISKVMGQEIIFDPLLKENFGNYCCIQNGSIIRNVTIIQGGYDEDLIISLASLTIIFVLLVLTITTGWFWRWEIQLLWKDRFGRLEENDDKDYDVFVSYDTQDAPFVLGILVPVLEDHFHYRCFAWERDSLAGEWISETLVQSINLSRRFLMVLSPALVENRWCMFALHIALKAVLQLQLHIICVKLQDVDWADIQLADKSTNDTIRQVLRVVRTVEWKARKREKLDVQKQKLIKKANAFNFDKLLKKGDGFQDEIRAPGQSKFWKKLRLYLPPRRSLPLVIKQPESPTSTKSLLSLPRGSDYC